MKVVRALWGFTIGLVLALGLGVVLGFPLGVVMDLARAPNLRVAPPGLEFFEFRREAGGGFGLEFGGPLVALVALAGGVYGAAWAARTGAGNRSSRQEIRLTWRWTLPAIAGSTVLFLAALAAMQGAYQAMHGARLPDLPGETWQRVLLFLAGLVLVIPVHELVHYAAYRLYGARPRYILLWKPFPGAGVYAPGHPLPRRAMLVVALAPAVLITSLGLVLLALPMLALPAMWIVAFNLAGAVGDLALAAWLLSLPRGAWIEDLRDGMRAVPAPVSPREVGLP